MDRWRRYPVVRLTLALLTGGFALVGLGLLGVGGTPVLVAALLAAAAGLAALARLARGTAVERVDPYRFYADLALGPAVAAALAAAFLGTNPGEVQTLGGLLGLAGMANYFLRPVYQVVYGGLVRLGAVGDGRDPEPDHE